MATDYVLMLNVVVSVLIAVIVYGASWRLFLSPLSKFPGPKLAALTLWYEFYYDIIKDGGGQYIWEIERMHSVYGKLPQRRASQSFSLNDGRDSRKHEALILLSGSIVRINPYELHINDFGFYDEIYANNHRRRDKYEWQVKSGNSAKAMGFTVNHQLHRLRRGAIDPYFSKRNVLQFESVIEAKTKSLCEVVTRYQAARKPMNLTSTLLATTMDIITEYAFADCYNLLDDEELSGRWMDTITCVMKNTALINHFGWLPRFVESLPPKVSQSLRIDMTMITEYKSVSHIRTVSTSLQCFDPFQVLARHC